MHRVLPAHRQEPSYCWRRSSISTLWSAPLQVMTAAERFCFERLEWNGLLPEVGSRMLTGVFTGQDLVDGWVRVQEGSYRYMIAQHGLMLVRTVIAEYLATEVYWSDEWRGDRHSPLVCTNHPS